MAIHFYSPVTKNDFIVKTISVSGGNLILTFISGSLVCSREYMIF